MEDSTHTVYDLHTHSIFSDGTLSPRELIRLARHRGIHVLALTDHDTMAGFPEGKMEAEQQGIVLLPAAEITTTWEGHEIHIVGLKLEVQSSTLQMGLNSLQIARIQRAQEIGHMLEKQGIPNAYEQTLGLVTGSLTTRKHFAQFLVRERYVQDIQEAFTRFLGEGAPAYVPGQWCSVEEAVTWIHQANGQAVLAHPARYLFDTVKLRRLLREFKNLEGDAIEIVSGGAWKEDIETMTKHARTFGFLGSVGSDYHGSSRGYGIDFGHLPPLPRGVEPIWKTWCPATSLTDYAITPSESEESTCATV